MDFVSFLPTCTERPVLLNCLSTIDTQVMRSFLEFCHHLIVNVQQFVGGEVGSLGFGVLVHKPAAAFVLFGVFKDCIFDFPFLSFFLHWEHGCLHEEQEDHRRCVVDLSDCAGAVCFPLFLVSAQSNFTICSAVCVAFLVFAFRCKR